MMPSISKLWYDGLQLSATHNTHCVEAVDLMAVTVCQAPPGGFLEDQLERGWWAASDAGRCLAHITPFPTPQVPPRPN